MTEPKPKSSRRLSKRGQASHHLGLGGAVLGLDVSLPPARAPHLLYVDWESAVLLLGSLTMAIDETYVRELEARVRNAEARAEKSENSAHDGWAEVERVWIDHAEVEQLKKEIERLNIDHPPPRKSWKSGRRSASRFRPSCKTSSRPPRRSATKREA